MTRWHIQIRDDSLRHSALSWGVGTTPRRALNINITRPLTFRNHHGLIHKPVVVVISCYYTYLQLVYSQNQGTAVCSPVVDNGSRQMTGHDVGTQSPQNELSVVKFTHIYPNYRITHGFMYVTICENGYLHHYSDMQIICKDQEQ